jgi:hypothetical protein
MYVFSVRVRRPGVEPGRLAALVPGTSVSAIPPRAHRADIRSRTGPSPVRRESREPRASAWLPGLDSNQQGQGSDPCWDADAPPGTACARRDSNPQHAAF